MSEYLVCPILLVVLIFLMAIKLINSRKQKKLQEKLDKFKDSVDKLALTIDKM